MKICFFGDAGNIHVQRAAMGLRNLGHHVRVVCHKPQPIPGVSVERFSVPRPGLANPYRWDTRFERYLRRFMRKFDLVILFFLHDWGFTPEIIADGCFVAFPQGSDIVPPTEEDPTPPELTEKRISLLRNAAVVATTGSRFAEIVGKFAGITVERIDLMPIGVDTTMFAPPRPPVDGRDDRHRVGFLKGFHPVYGPRCLVEAIPRILNDLPTTRFDLVGDGPELAPCQDLAVELGVAGAINWLPRRPHEEIPGLIARWDLTVIPSLRESFGVAALESSAMGVPVVASNVGGLPDTVHDGHTGLRVPPQMPDALAEAVVGLLRDPDRRRRMGETGCEWVRREYEWSRVLRQWEQVFERALDERAVMV